MNNRIIICFFFALAIGLSSCENDSTGDVSSVTYFPEFTMSGENLQFIPCGGTYTDSGVVAEENGQDLTVAVDATGTYYGAATVDAGAPDKYVVNYSAENSDGFIGGVERTVYIACTGDLVNSIEGLFTATVVRGGEPSAQYEDMGYVIIKSAGGSDYSITDALSAYYDVGRAYGPDYAARGSVITLSDDGITATTGVFPIWGNVVTLSDIVIDAENKTISYHASGDFGNGEFEVVLTQVNF